MRVSLQFILSSLLIGAYSVSCFAREWQGIVPLRSTRSEVIKLLGPPKHVLWDYRDYFEVENAIVTFTWIDPGCSRKYPITPDSSIQPGDLVLGISLRLKQPMAQGDLGLPEQDKFYFTSCFGGIKGSCSFADDGFSYSTSNTLLTRLSYGPTKNEFAAWEQIHHGCVSSRDGQ